MRPYRVERVASLVREVVSEAIARRISDPRVSPLTTITRVKVSGDLLTATVYLTVTADPVAERLSVTALQHATGFIQRLVAKELELRQCPELRFAVDEELKKVQHTMDLLRENRKNRPDLFPKEEWEAADEAVEAERSADDAEGASAEEPEEPS